MIDLSRVLDLEGETVEIEAYPEYDISMKPKEFKGEIIGFMSDRQIRLETESGREYLIPLSKIQAVREV